MMRFCAHKFSSIYILRKTCCAKRNINIIQSTFEHKIIVYYIIVYNYGISWFSRGVISIRFVSAKGSLQRWPEDGSVAISCIARKITYSCRVDSIVFINNRTELHGFFFLLKKCLDSSDSRCSPQLLHGAIHIYAHARV